MNQRKPKPKTPSKSAVNAEEASDTEERTEERTEVHGEYKGGKIRVLFGRNGTVITWAVAWAVAILSTVLAAGMLVKILETMKQLGVF